MLTKIRGLQWCRARRPFPSRGKDLDTPTVARRLNVGMILEGSVRKSGKRVRIATQLIQAATDSRVWAGTYDRTLEDAFRGTGRHRTIGCERVASYVIGAATLCDRGRAGEGRCHRVGRGRSKNAEAHQLYLQAQFLVERHTPEDTARCIECYLGPGA